jgi:hypothetical protein
MKKYRVRVASADWEQPKVYQGKSMHQEELENLVTCDGCGSSYAASETAWVRTPEGRVRLCVDCAKKMF